MLNFITQAFAQDAAAVPPAAGPLAGIMNFLPIILIFIVFWVIVIRPQQKKLEEQQKMIKALQRGDRIVTSGGIHGKIVKLEGDEHLIVEIADGVEVKIGRSHVNALEAKPEPVSAEKK
ncbi:MAG: preprotein translocase subunit YajC [Alphaproteobacteria bacterium]|nr:preprotein translocase subunit YajC [Alphaproteobacteria bacterium]